MKTRTEKKKKKATKLQVSVFLSSRTKLDSRLITLYTGMDLLEVGEEPPIS